MKTKIILSSVSLMLLPAAMPCFAVIEPVSPGSGEMVALVPDAQKKAMSLPTLDERLKLFAKDKASGKVLRHDPFWRKSKPLELKWRATEGEVGPWKIEIGKSPDLSDARVWYFSDLKTDAACGPKCSPRHANKKGRCLVRSTVAAFRTEDLPPRWIEIEGRVGNFRDFGGRRTADGRRVKQGMAYRGQGLNDNSITGDEPGRNRLTVEDVKYLTGTLGIRTDLDLRSDGETAKMKESPLGPGVAFIQRSSACYAGIFTSDGKKVMAENFRVFCRPENYPIYFHCIGGADRTGSLAYVLNGVLGVDRHELETDWESTFYPRIPDANPDPHFWCRESHFNNGFSKYGKEGDSWNRRIELYLLDCGVTKEEIQAFRLIMLE